MLSNETLILILVLAIIGAWFWHHLGIRQIALRHARQTAKKEGVQLLDDSIVLARIRLCRSPDTAIAFQRTYQFEFSSLGDRRFLGWVILKGRRLETVELQPYSERNWLQ